MKKTKILFLVLLIVCLSAGMVYATDLSKPSSWNSYSTTYASYGSTFYLPYNGGTLSPSTSGTAYWTVTGVSRSEQYISQGYWLNDITNGTWIDTSYWWYTYSGGTVTQLTVTGDDYTFNGTVANVYVTGGTYRDGGSNAVLAYGTSVIYGSTGTDLNVTEGTIDVYGSFESILMNTGGPTVNTHSITVSNPETDSNPDYGIRVYSGTLNLNGINTISANDYGLYLTGGDVTSSLTGSGSIHGVLENGVYANAGTIYLHDYDVTTGTSTKYPILLDGSANLRIDATTTVTGGLGTVYGGADTTTLIVDNGTRVIRVEGVYYVLNGTVTTGDDLRVGSTSNASAKVVGDGAGHALIVDSGIVTISGSLGTVTINGGDVSAIGGSIYNDVTINDGILTVEGADLIIGETGVTGYIDNDGEFIVNSGRVYIPFTNEGTYEVNGGTVSGNITNSSTGDLYIDGGTVSGNISNTGGDIYIAGGTFTGTISSTSGNLYVSSSYSGAAVKVNGTFGNIAGPVTMSGNNLVINNTNDSSPATYTSNAAIVTGNASYTLTVNGGDVTLNGDVSAATVTGGKLTDNGGNDVTATGGTVVGNTTLSANSTNLHVDNNSGTISSVIGYGTFNAVVVDSGDTLNVTSAATSVNGTVINSGTLNVNIGTSVTGVVTNSGILNVNAALTASANIANSGNIYVKTGGSIVGTVVSTTGNLYVISGTTVDVRGTFSNIAGSVKIVGGTLVIEGTTDASTYGSNSAVVNGNSQTSLTVKGGEVALNNKVTTAYLYNTKLTDNGGNKVYAYGGTVVGGVTDMSQSAPGPSTTTYTALYVDGNAVTASAVIAYGNFDTIEITSGDALTLSSITMVTGSVSNAGIFNVNAALTASADITNSGNIYVKTGGTIDGTVISTTGNLYVRSETTVDARGIFSNIAGNVAMTGGTLTINGTTDSTPATYITSAAIVTGVSNCALTVNGGYVTLNGDVTKVDITEGTINDNGGNTVNSSASEIVHVHGIGTSLDATGSAITYANGTFELVTGSISNCEDLTITYAGITSGGIATYAAIKGSSSYNYDLTLIGGYTYIEGEFEDIINSGKMEVTNSDANVVSFANTGNVYVPSGSALTIGVISSGSVSDSNIDNDNLRNSGTGKVYVDSNGLFDGDMINTSAVSGDGNYAVYIGGNLYGNLTTSAGSVYVTGTDIIVADGSPENITSLDVLAGKAYVKGDFGYIVGAVTMSGSLDVYDTSTGKATVTGWDDSLVYNNTQIEYSLTIEDGTVDIIEGRISYLNVLGGSVAVTGGVFTGYVNPDYVNTLGRSSAVYVTSPGILAVSGGYFIDKSMAEPTNYIITGYTYYETTLDGTLYYKVSRIVISGGGSFIAPTVIKPTLRFNIGNINSYQTTGSAIEMLRVMDVAPIIQEDRTLLPIRFVVEPLGGTITWNEPEQKVTIVRGETTIELWIGNNIAKVNGVEMMIDPENPNVKPIIVTPGRTMLPLRFISEALGCTVTWDEAKQQIVVEY